MEPTLLISVSIRKTPFDKSTLKHLPKEGIVSFQAHKPDNFLGEVKPYASKLYREWGPERSVTRGTTIVIKFILRHYRAFLCGPGVFANYALPECPLGLLLSDNVYALRKNRLALFSFIYLMSVLCIPVIEGFPSRGCPLCYMGNTTRTQRIVCHRVLH